MNKNKALRSLVIGLPLLAVSAFGTSYAFAADTTVPGQQVKGAYRMERTALTDTQKATLQEAKALRDAGKTEEATALLKSADLPERGFRGGQMGERGGMRDGFGNKEAHTAIEDGDYTAWKTAMKDFPNQSVLTQELFNKMVTVEKLHNEIHSALTATAS